jgi:hypothetical protein
MVIDGIVFESSYCPFILTVEAVYLEYGIIYPMAKIIHVSRRVCKAHPAIVLFKMQIVFDVLF